MHISLCICIYVFYIYVGMFCTGMSACICINVCMTVIESVCIYICVYGFISLKIMLFFYLLNENFQRCTKVKRSKVHTSASTFFRSICEIINIVIFTMFI